MNEGRNAKEKEGFSKRREVRFFRRPRARTHEGVRMLRIKMMV